MKAFNANLLRCFNMKAFDANLLRCFNVRVFDASRSRCFGMKKIILAGLRVYKRFISPALGQRCRFFPSCSEYMYVAVQRYGAARGFWMGLKRLARCQPFSKGGYDPVP